MRWRQSGLLGACALPLLVSAVFAQAPAVPPPVSQAPSASTPADALGRGTPRGTVLGFLTAGRRGEFELAAQHLDTRLRGAAAETLAGQLFAVLDARLPPRLTQISDAAEGSRSNPLAPDRELVGTIRNESGGLDVFVDRVTRPTGGPIWLFSTATLDSIPALYEEVTAASGGGVFPRFLTITRIGGVRLLDWLAVLLSVPVFYLATALVNRLLVPLTRPLWRRLLGATATSRPNALPVPARLLLFVLVGQWLLPRLPLSLAFRQFWSSAAVVTTIFAAVWLLILVNGAVEQYIHRHLPQSNVPAAASLVRVLRRTVDVLIIFAGLLATLRHFNVDPTPALAGLGVGGIAVALAAQKTLENVVAGASLIFDQAVRAGDFLKMGELEGTVDHIGLRSTRIRTLDRTIVSVPNSQIANASLETLSARDKFWFHPVVGLRYETTPEQLHAVVNGIRRLLEEHPLVQVGSVRVRFIRLGAFSLDVDVFTYLACRDWNHFLEIQENLLFSVADIVARAGAEIAFPSQTMYVANPQSSLAAAGTRPMG